MNELRESVAWIIATVATVATMLSGAYVWWREQEAKKRKTDNEEMEELAIPYRKAFRELKNDLIKSQEGLAKLQVEHTQSLVRIARLEADNENCQATNKRLTEELKEIKLEVAKLRGVGNEMEETGTELSD